VHPPTTGQLQIFVERPKKKKKDKEGAADAQPKTTTSLPAPRKKDVKLRGNLPEKSLRKHRPGEEPHFQASPTTTKK
jgi:hypothetical protein